MSLNDPFGRVSRRQQAAYRAFREQLHQQGVLSAHAVRTARGRLKTTSLRVVAVAAAAALIAGVLAPAVAAVSGVLLALFLVWLGASYLQTRAHLNRYMQEVAARPAAGQTTDKDRHNAEENEP